VNINWDKLNLDPQLLWADYILPWGTQIVLAIVVFFVGRMIARAVTNGTRKVMEKASLEPMLVNFLSNIIGSVLLLLVIVFSLSQLGVDTTSLVALLGAAGLAVGLALKDSLSHFAAGVMLILFRPFKVGDFCELDGNMGTVEQITILHTRLKTPDNKVITIPNGNVFSGTMTNFSEQPTRRVDMVFGIGYGSDLLKAKKYSRRNGERRRTGFERSCARRQSTRTGRFISQPDLPPLGKLSRLLGPVLGHDGKSETALR